MNIFYFQKMGKKKDGVLSSVNITQKALEARQGFSNQYP